MPSSPVSGAPRKYLKIEINHFKTICGVVNDFRIAPASYTSVRHTKNSTKIFVSNSGKILLTSVCGVAIGKKTALIRNPHNFEWRANQLPKQLLLFRALNIDRSSGSGLASEAEHQLSVRAEMRLNVKVQRGVFIRNITTIAAAPACCQYINPRI